MYDAFCTDCFKIIISVVKSQKNMFNSFVIPVDQKNGMRQCLVYQLYLLFIFRFMHQMHAPLIDNKFE